MIVASSTLLIGDAQMLGLADQRPISGG